MLNCHEPEGGDVSSGNEERLCAALDYADGYARGLRSAQSAADGNAVSAETLISEAALRGWQDGWRDAVPSRNAEEALRCSEALRGAWAGTD